MDYYSFKNYEEETFITQMIPNPVNEHIKEKFASEFFDSIIENFLKSLFFILFFKEN